MQPEDDIPLFDPTLKKKHKKKTNIINKEDEYDFGKRKRKRKTAATTAAAEPKSQQEEGYYTYNDLLKRLYGLLQEHGHDISERETKLKIPSPKLGYGSKKTLCLNFQTIVGLINRENKHITNYFSSEIASICSIDGAGRLVMREKVKQRDFESLLRKYIKEYVQCNVCKSHTTFLKRESKMNWLVCELCGSRRTVKDISIGFRANIRKKKNKT